MNGNKQARLMIGGTGSGCGKTTVMAALLQAFCQRKMTPAAFKCGPDYIDPMFHRWITGKPSVNLDSVFLSEEKIRALLGWHMTGNALGLMEGVMGYYDGQGKSSRASSYEIAAVTKTPVILVVRPKGAALSVAALVQGYQNFRETSWISGVILNGIRPAMYTFYKEIIEEETGLDVFGFLPDTSESVFESRHLGLVTAQEQENLTAKIEYLGHLAEKYIDLDGLVKLAGTAEPINFPEAFAEFRKGAGVRLAVAMDKAFCFYYEDNLECLRRLGVEICPFSPLTDEKLPENIHGIYLGGGYPELYGEALSGNVSMLEDIRRAVKERLPVLAECGGYMYLAERLTDGAGQSYLMAGIVSGHSQMADRLGPFGYAKLWSEKETLIGRGPYWTHEFHYSVMRDEGDIYQLQKENGRIWKGGSGSSRLYAAYPHLNFYGNPEIAKRFVREMEAVRNDD